MQTITLRARSDEAGTVKLEIPTELADQEIEFVVVMQPVTAQPVDEMGYPIGYFDKTYGSFADDPIERNQPPADVRDEIE